MARRDPEDQPVRIAGEDDVPQDEQPSPEKPGIVRYVAYGLGEGKDTRWGWEGLDIGGQVVESSKPEFESSAAAIAAGSGR